MTKKPAPKKTKKTKAVSDQALWEDVAKTVKPLTGRAKNRHAAPAAQAPEKDAPPPIPAPQPKRPRRPALPPAPAGKKTPPPELFHGTTAGLDKRTAERMKKGALKIEARLDLHGHTQAEARRALEAFILKAVAHGVRQVLVITGKGGGKGGARGGGVLREMVPRWINLEPLRPHVVAFDHAARKDGGEGALYVRLRKPRDT